MELEVKLRDEVEIESEFTYLSGVCEAAATARTTCGWVKSSVCGE